MASASSKAASVTTLRIGKVEIGVGLFTAHADPKKKLVEFDTAGPSGGVLKMRAVARPAPVEEAVERSDPFGGDLFGAPPPETDEAPAPVAMPDGQYGQELVEEGTGEVVAPQDVRRGVRLADGSFIDCTAELAKIDKDTKLDGMTVIGFVDSTAISRERVRNAYWLGAMDEKAPFALRIVYEGVKARRRVALVKVTQRSRQKLGVIGWRGPALMFYELVWSEDLRDAPAKALAIQKVSVSEQAVANMSALIDAMSVPPSAVAEIRDDAIALREELHERALRGEIEATAADVVALEEDNDLMAQIEASLAGVA